MYEEPGVRDFPTSLRARLIATAGSISLALVVAFVDRRTGVQLSLLPLYAAPVVIAAWLAGRGSGIATAVAASVGLLVVESLERRYTHPGFAYWNAIAAGAVLAALAAAIARLREIARRERESSRTDALTGARTQRDF